MSVEKYMNDTYKLKTVHGLMLLAKMAPPKPSVEEEALGKTGAKGVKKGEPSKRATYHKKKNKQKNNKQIT